MTEHKKLETYVASLKRFVESFSNPLQEGRIVLGNTTIRDFGVYLGQDLGYCKMPEEVYQELMTSFSALQHWANSEIVKSQKKLDAVEELLSGKSADKP